MQIPKWVWCCVGGLIGVVPMMGATILDRNPVQCVNQDSSGERVTVIASDCDRPNVLSP